MEIKRNCCFRRICDFSYLIVVSMGYDHQGKRLKPQQKTVKPRRGLTNKQTEKWLNEQATLFEMECRNIAPVVNKKITLAEYTAYWLKEIAPDKMAKSTLIREKQDIARFLPELGHYKLTELRPEHFRKYYTKLRKTISEQTGKPLSEHTVEGVHACLCGILSDAVEGGYISHNPAWRTYKYSGKKKEKTVADEDTMRLLMAALKKESLKYETFWKASDIQLRLHFSARFTLVLIKGVAVDVQRGGRLGVTEESSHGGHIRTACDQEARIGMAQRMDVQILRQTVFSQDLLRRVIFAAGFA